MSIDEQKNKLVSNGRHGLEPWDWEVVEGDPLGEPEKDFLAGARLDRGRPAGATAAAPTDLAVGRDGEE